MSKSAAEIFVRTVKNFDRYGVCYPERVEILEQLAEAVAKMDPPPTELAPIIEKLQAVKSLV